MKNILLSQNMNSWISQSDLSLAEKIDLFSDYLKKKYRNLAEVVVINLQEVIGGGDGLYLNALQKAFPGYDIITPISFNHLQHHKSLMNVTLVREGLGYMPIRFDSCLPNRIVYLKVWLNDNPTPIRIMNVYSVQTAVFSKGAAPWYIFKRKEQKEELWSAVLAEAERCRHDPLIICGDMQESSTGKHIQKLTEMGFKEKNGSFFPTVRNEIFTEQCIDHLLYNEKAWKICYPVSIEHDANLLDVLSDHVLLAATSA